MSELWRLVSDTGTNHYEVSSQGHVRRAVNRRTAAPAGSAPWRYLKPYKRPDGALRVRLGLGDGTHRQALVHRLVWETFNGPITHDMYVRQKDGDKANCSLANLELKPKSSILRNHRTRGEACPNAKLTEVQVAEAKARLSTAPRYPISGRIQRGQFAAIAHDLDIPLHSLRDIQLGRAWSHVC